MATLLSRRIEREGGIRKNRRFSTALPAEPFVNKRNFLCTQIYIANISLAIHHALLYSHHGVQVSPT
jgi:hypothetical protein